MRRQELNVLPHAACLGAEVRGVGAGSAHAEGCDQTRRCATGSTNVRDTVPSEQRAGRASRTHDGAQLPPRDRPSTTRAQMLEQEGKLPDGDEASVAGRRSPNAIGAFYAGFSNDKNVQPTDPGVEAGGRGTALGEHAANFQKSGGGLPGVQGHLQLHAAE